MRHVSLVKHFPRHYTESSFYGSSEKMNRFFITLLSHKKRNTSSEKGLGKKVWLVLMRLNRYSLTAQIIKVPIYRINIPLCEFNLLTIKIARYFRNYEKPRDGIMNEIILL